MNQVLIEQDPSPMKLEVLNVDDWPAIKEPDGRNERHYGQTETSYILEGEGVIETPDGEKIAFAAGDLVTVMPETTCTWHITKAIERHYKKG